MTETTKICTKCNKGGEGVRFYRKRTTPSGLSYTCTVCDRARDELWKSKNRTRYNEIRYAYMKRFPERQKARDAVKRALVRGELVKKSCEVCGEIKSQAHHEDYTKPLEVIWLCTTHHAKKHYE